MYLLSIIVGNASVALMYQSEETANKAIATAENSLCEWDNAKANGHNTIILSDDFGQAARIMAKHLHGFIIENLNLSKAARAEQMLHNARCQALAQKLGQADAGLRALHGAPSVITPQMGPNGLRG